MTRSSLSSSTTASSLKNLARRPVRRRKSVTHYSDDNPNCFTVKRKKGDPEVEEQPQQQRSRDEAASSSSLFVEQPKKRKVGRPPTNKSKQQQQRPPQQAAESQTPKPEDTTTMLTMPVASSSQQQENTAPEKEEEDAILSHAALIQPILPCFLTTEEILQRSRPTVLSDTVWSFNKNRSFPQWQSVTTFNTSTNTAQSSATTTSTTNPTTTATARITWWSARSDHYDDDDVDTGCYAVSGDCWGIVSLWKDGHLIRRITNTSAYTRERNRIVKSKKVISYPNAILQCTWHRSMVIIFTAQEIEAIDIQQTQNHHHHPSLAWSIPIRSVQTETMANLKKMGGGTPQTPALQLIHHKQSQQEQYSLLWSTWNREIGTDHNDDYDDDVESKTITTTAQSLLLIKFQVPRHNPWNRHDENDDNNRTAIPIKKNPIPCWYKLQPNTTNNNHPNDDCNIQTTTMQMFQCWTTLWEKKQKLVDSDHRHEDDDDKPTFLAIAQTANETIELIRASIQDHHKMRVHLRKTLSPCNTSSTEVNTAMTTIMLECNIQQFQEYTFVMVGTWGIRMLDTNTLDDVAIFGDSVQLHGKSMVWNRCLWISTNSSVLHPNDTVRVFESSTSHKKKMMMMNGYVIERPDELAVRYHDPTTLPSATTRSTGEGLESASSSQRRRQQQQQNWLIGIPHPFKGPAELRSTMYLWKAPSRHDHNSSSASLLSTMNTVLLPGPTGGWCGDVLFPNHNMVTLSRHFMVGVDAVSGEVCTWKPNLRTDFAGVMYPTEYKVITDNWEYIEDEDELDHVARAAVVNLEATTKQSVLGLQKGEAEDVHMDDDTDPDLKEALRLSLLEHEQRMEKIAKSETPLVSVLPEDDENDHFFVPCWPQLDESSSDGESTISAHSPVHSPQRAISGSTNGNDVGFETIFLSSYPCTKKIRHDLCTLVEKHSQLEAEERALLPSQSNALEGDESVMDTSCNSQSKNSNAAQNKSTNATSVAKASTMGKRARMANIESVLWNSVDNSLRRKMYRWRGKFADGTASIFVFPSSNVSMEAESSSLKEEIFFRDNEGRKIVREYNKEDDTVDPIEVSIPSSSIQRPPPIASRTTSEEKLLAMELLLLSPANAVNSDSCNGEINQDEKSSSAMITSQTKRISTEKLESDHGASAVVSINASSILQDKPSSDAPKMKNNADGFDAADNNSVVTPLQPTPTQVPLNFDLPSAVSQIVSGQEGTKIATVGKAYLGLITGDTSNSFCPACLGRMVMHCCGKREKPIDYEALARAEEERRQREAEEKARARAEKRKIAESKRREARKQKKMDEERKILQKMEHMRQLEGQRFDEESLTRGREQQDSWIQQDSYEERHFTSPQTNFPMDEHIAAFQETVNSSSGESAKPANYTRNFDENPRQEHHSQNIAWDEHQTSSIRRGSIQIDGTEVKPSTCLSPADALSALAGLAMAVPIAESLSTSHFLSKEREANHLSSDGESTKWASAGEQSYRHQYIRHEPYQYNGSAERRANIHKALHGHTAFNGYGESSTFPEYSQDDYVEQEIALKNADTEAKSTAASIVYTSTSSALACENTASTLYDASVDEKQMHHTVQVKYSDKEAIIDDAMSNQKQLSDASRYLPVLPKAQHLPLQTSQFAPRVLPQLEKVHPQEPQATPCITYAESFEAGIATPEAQSELKILGDHSLQASEKQHEVYVHEKEQPRLSHQNSIDAVNPHSDHSGTK